MSKSQEGIETISITNAARTYNATTKGRKLKNVPEETKQEVKEEPKLLNNATKKALLLSKRAR